MRRIPCRARPFRSMSKQVDDSGRLRMNGSVPLDDVRPADYVARAVFLTDARRLAAPCGACAWGEGSPSGARSAPAFPSGGAPSSPAEPPAAGVARPAEPAPEAAPAPVSHATPAVNVDELMPASVPTSNATPNRCRS